MVETMDRATRRPGPDRSLHEAIYRLIYALPKGNWPIRQFCCATKQTQRRTRKKVGERSARIVGMVLHLTNRPEEANDQEDSRRWWEEDLIVRKDSA